MNFSPLRWPVLLTLLCVICSSAIAAQTENARPCMKVHPAVSATVHGYLFRTYDPDDPDDPACLRILHDGKIVYQLDEEQRYELGQPGDANYKVPFVANGADLTGDGHPDMIATSWSGGAHCCYMHYVFELEPKFRVLAVLKDGDAYLAHFEHLDSTSRYYYVTTDIWSYWPSSFASSVSHKVILAWNGKIFRLDLAAMRRPPPTSQQWRAALTDVDDALKNGGDVRGALGVTLWDTALDLIYTGHSDLAWKFVGEVNPEAFKGDNPSLGDFCSLLEGDKYWQELRLTLQDLPEECASPGGSSKK